MTGRKKTHSPDCQRVKSNYSKPCNCGASGTDDKKTVTVPPVVSATVETTPSTQPIDMAGPPPLPSGNEATSPPTDSRSILDSILTEGEVKDNNMASRLKPEEGPTTSDGKKDSGGSSVAMVTAFIRPEILMMVGDRLASFTGENMYRLDKDGAIIICGLLGECFKDSKAKANPWYMLAFVMFMWLGVPTIFYVWKHKDKIGAMLPWGKKKTEGEGAKA